MGGGATRIGHNWIRAVARACFLVLCALAVVIAIGAPGLGWMLTAVLLYAGGFAAPCIGRTRLVMSLAVGVLNLVTFGPLAGLAWPAGMPAGVVIFFIVLPLLTTVVAICSPALWRRGGQRP